ncbi:MAG: Imm32 family immunity protein [Abyssibacter sp.]|uniref:Imm32 family immunity protein n=1 Tax=Abyssibacter sp. TaxID=2320200 RepID=UPI003218FE23
MPKEIPLLSVNTSPDGMEVSIHADAEGLKLLATEIERLRNGLEENQCEHAHFFSDAWGGDELSEVMLDSEKSESRRQARHVKLYAWTTEWKGRHGL